MPDPQGCLVCSLDGLSVVSPPAEIDITNAHQLRVALMSASSKCPIVVVDMSQTVFCDSAGLQVLARAHKRALADGGELRLVITATSVLRILALTGLDRVLPIFATMPDALAAGPVPAARPWSSQRPLMTDPALLDSAAVLLVEEDHRTG